MADSNLDNSGLNQHKLYAILIYFLALCGLGCGTNEAPITPLLTGCEEPPMASRLPIGIGKDLFEGLDSIDEALIVGGYQGGHHLWGAIRLPNATRPRDVQRLHMMVCAEGEPLAQALYDSVLGLQKNDQDVFGVPIVFSATVDVGTLGETRVSLWMAAETDDRVYAGQGDVTLRCCGHVADGD